MSSLAQEESRSISENVRWGFRKKMEDGKFSLPYSRFLGYDRGPDGKLVVNKAQAKTVRRIYGMFLSGLSYNRIAKELTEAHIPSPSGLDHWNYPTVQSILTNETYMGDKILQKTYKEDFLHKERKRNTGVVPMYHIEQDHEAIIDPETFKRVQDEIMRRKGGSKLSGMTIFSDKIFCGKCGSAYGPKVWHSKDKYRKVIWRCNDKYEKGHFCRNDHVDEKQIMEGFVNVCNAIMGDREEILADLRETMTVIDEKLGALRTELGAAEKERNDLGERLQKMMNANARVAMDQEKYRADYDRMLKKYAKAEERVGRTEKEIQEAERRKREVGAVLEGVGGMEEIVRTFSPELWSTLVERVTVVGRGDLVYRLRDGREVRGMMDTVDAVE